MKWLPRRQRRKDATERDPGSSNAGNPDHAGWSSVIWWDPLVIATWSSLGLELGLLSVPGALENRTCKIILLPANTLDDDQTARRLAHAYMEHVSSFPHHHIVLAASDEAEVAALARAGMRSVIVNANCFVSERIFRPLPEIAPEFIAVSNGRLWPQKRHELAQDLQSLAVVFFRNHLVQSPAQFHAAYAQHCQMLPNATFMNPITHDGCARLTLSEVNEVYARSRVGLCLSAVEGTMRAAMEYMLAGLPVVSTPSKGGREYFFDPDFCLIADDNPRSVAEATNALAARDIPREHVRSETLKKVHRERDKFVALVDDLISADQRGQSSRETIHYLIAESRIQPWRTLAPLLQEIERRDAGRQNHGPGALTRHGSSRSQDRQDAGLRSA